jgi:multidrug efflux pump subunit AcrA (membrane-fusion protein)
MKLLPIGIALVLVALVTNGCSRSRSGDGEDGELPLVTIRPSLVRKGTITTSVSATGRTDALRKQDVVSPVNGLLVSLKVLEGAVMKRGDVIAVVSPKEAHYAIIGAEARLQSATTEAERRDARAALDLARSHQNEVVVRAGADGVVASRRVSEGQLVTENESLVELVDLSSIVFIADVPLRDAMHIRNHQAAMVSLPALPGTEIHGAVDAVYPQSDAKSQTVGVRILLADAPPVHLLKIGMIGQCRIVTGVHNDVLIVLRQALLHDDETNAISIVAVTTDSLAYHVPVAVRAITDSLAEIEGEGIHPGMIVALEGNYGLPDSTRVTWQTAR